LLSQLLKLFSSFKNAGNFEIKLHLHSTRFYVTYFGGQGSFVDV